MKVKIDVLEKNIDEKNFNEDQLLVIKSILNNDQIKDSISLVLDSKYNYKQMIQIKIGLKKKLDVSMYAKAKYDEKLMKEIRLLLLQKIDKKLIKDLIKEYNTEQIREIRLGLKDEIAIDVYKNPKYHFTEMHDIRKNLAKYSKGKKIIK